MSISPENNSLPPGNQGSTVINNNNSEESDLLLERGGGRVENLGNLSNGISMMMAPEQVASIVKEHKEYALRLDKVFETNQHYERENQQLKLQLDEMKVLVERQKDSERRRRNTSESDKDDQIQGQQSTIQQLTYKNQEMEMHRVNLEGKYTAASKSLTEQVSVNKEKEKELGKNRLTIARLEKELQGLREKMDKMETRNLLVSESGLTDLGVSLCDHFLLRRVPRPGRVEKYLKHRRKFLAQKKGATLEDFPPDERESNIRRMYLASDELDETILGEDEGEDDDDEDMKGSPPFRGARDKPKKQRSAAAPSTSHSQQSAKKQDASAFQKPLPPPSKAQQILQRQYGGATAPRGPPGRKMGLGGGVAPMRPQDFPPRKLKVPDPAEDVETSDEDSDPLLLKKATSFARKISEPKISPLRNHYSPDQEKSHKKAEKSREKKKRKRILHEDDAANEATLRKQSRPVKPGAPAPSTSRSSEDASVSAAKRLALDTCSTEKGDEPSAESPKDEVSRTTNEDHIMEEEEGQLADSAKSASADAVEAAPATVSETDKAAEAKQEESGELIKEKRAVERQGSNQTMALELHLSPEGDRSLTIAEDETEKGPNPMELLNPFSPPPANVPSAELIMDSQRSDPAQEILMTDSDETLERNAEEEEEEENDITKGLKKMKTEKRAFLEDEEDEEEQLVIVEEEKGRDEGDSGLAEDSGLTADLDSTCPLVIAQDEPSFMDDTKGNQEPETASPVRKKESMDESPKKRGRPKKKVTEKEPASPEKEKQPTRGRKRGAVESLNRPETIALGVPAGRRTSRMDSRNSGQGTPAAVPRKSFVSERAVKEVERRSVNKKADRAVQTGVDNMLKQKNLSLVAKQMVKNLGEVGVGVEDLADLLVDHITKELKSDQKSKFIAKSGDHSVISIQEGKCFSFLDELISLSEGEWEELWPSLIPPLERKIQSVTADSGNRARVCTWLRIFSEACKRVQDSQSFNLMMKSVVERCERQTVMEGLQFMAAMWPESFLHSYRSQEFQNHKKLFNAMMGRAGEVQAGRVGDWLSKVLPGFIREEDILRFSPDMAEKTMQFFVACAGTNHLQVCWVAEEGWGKVSVPKELGESLIRASVMFENLDADSRRSHLESQSEAVSQVLKDLRRQTDSIDFNNYSIQILLFGCLFTDFVKAKGLHTN